MKIIMKEQRAAASEKERIKSNNKVRSFIIITAEIFKGYKATNKVPLMYLETKAKPRKLQLRYLQVSSVFILDCHLCLTLYLTFQKVLKWCYIRWYSIIL